VKKNMALIASLVITVSMLSVCTQTVFALTEQGIEPWGTFAGTTAGEQNTINGHYNVFFGSGAGYFNNEGYKNTFVGTESGFANNAGSYNTFVGYRAGWQNSAGQNNTCIGTTSCYLNATSGNNTYIGKDAGYNNRSAGNVSIGYHAGFVDNGSNLLQISNSGISASLIYGEFDNQLVEINGRLVFASDEKLKKNIEPLKGSLDRVTRLKGISYEWKDQVNRGKGKNIGFIAEEVEKIIPELVHMDRKGDKSLSYDRFAPVLIAAIQEQQAMIDEYKSALASKSLMIERRRQALAEQDAVIKDLAAQLAVIKAEINKLKSRDLRAQK